MSLSIRIAGILALAVLLHSLSIATSAEPGPSPRVIDRVGLQLYSLRNEFKADGVEATLDKVRGWGIKYVELAGTYNLPVEKFLGMLAERKLVAIAAHFPYNRLQDEPEKVADEAKQLGLKYMGCAWIAHKQPFDEAQCRQAAGVFNRAGAAAAERGMKFFYHIHGYEFRPHGDGTLFDLLVTQTDPKWVTYELDVLWTLLPGQDPAKLLEKYPTRFDLVHLKDLKKGVPTGDHSAKTSLLNDVTLGTGQVQWPEFFAAAKKIGVKYYFIEDESPNSVQQIPQSLKFLKQF